MAFRPITYTPLSDGAPDVESELSTESSNLLSSLRICDANDKQVATHSEYHAKNAPNANDHDIKQLRVIE